MHENELKYLEQLISELEEKLQSTIDETEIEILQQKYNEKVEEYKKLLLEQEAWKKQQKEFEEDIDKINKSTKKTAQLKQETNNLYKLTGLVLVGAFLWDYSKKKRGK